MVWSMPDDAIARIISLKADLALLEKVQLRLEDLVHSFRCLQAERHSGKNACSSCFSNCKNLKKLLEHMESCKVVEDCPEPECSSSRQIIEHWKKCRKPYGLCPLCTRPPLRCRVVPKDWHYIMTIEERNHLTDLLPQGHFYKSESTSFHKRRPLLRRKPKETQQQQMMHCLDTQFYYENPEWIIYEKYAKANSRAEYYHLIAEEIWSLERDRLQTQVS